MRRILVLFLILTSIQTLAQKKEWSLTYTPALLELPSLRYGIQMGGAYNFNQRLQLLSEITIATGKPDEASITNTSYFRIKPELRYLLSKDNTPFRIYMGMQASFIKRSWSNSNSGVFYEGSFSNDSVIHYSSCKIQSPAITLTTQVGGILKLNKKLSIDGFLGLGVKSIFTNYSAIANPKKEITQYAKCRIMFRPDPAWWVDGTLTRFQINTGIRLLYSL